MLVSHPDSWAIAHAGVAYEKFAAIAIMTLTSIGLNLPRKIDRQRGIAILRQVEIASALAIKLVATIQITKMISRKTSGGTFPTTRLKT